MSENTQHRPSKLRERSTGDLMILIVAGTICATVLFSVFGAFVFKMIHPEYDLNKTYLLVADILNTMIGLLAGFIAGRSRFGEHNGD